MQKRGVQFLDATGMDTLDPVAQYDRWVAYDKSERRPLLTAMCEYREYLL
jgi:hypothetical protein